MKVTNKKEFLENLGFFIKEMAKGRTFIYPTDTIYGIGCDAANKKAVIKIRKIKNREIKPFSVIAPSKYWIKKNFFLSKNNERWLKKLPGEYTFILKIKNKNVITKEVNNGMRTLGIRMPDNWFSKVVGKFGKPFVTTSVNLSGEKHIKSLDELNKEIANKIDYFVDEGILDNNPSTILDLTNGEKILER